MSERRERCITSQSPSIYGPHPKKVRLVIGGKRQLFLAPALLLPNRRKYVFERLASLLRLSLLHLTEYSILVLGLDNAGKTTFLNTLKALYSTSPSQPTLTTPNPLTTPLNPKPTVPTVGQNVSTLDLPDMYLKIWDLGGQQGLRGLWTKYLGVTHAIVWIVDSCDVGDDEDDDNDDNRRGNSNDADEEDDSTTAAALNDQGQDMRKHSSRLDEARRALLAILSHPHTHGIPLLVLANKQDREDCVETVRIKEGLVRKVFEAQQQQSRSRSQDKSTDADGDGGAGDDGEEGGGGFIRDSRVLPVSALRGDGVVEAVEWVRTRVRWNFREGGRGPVMR